MTHRSSSSSSTPMATRLVNTYTHTHPNQPSSPSSASARKRAFLACRDGSSPREAPPLVAHCTQRTSPALTHNRCTACTFTHTLTHAHTLLFSGKLAVHSRCNTGPISFPLIVAPKQLCGGPWLFAPGFHLGTRQRKAAMRVCWVSFFFFFFFFVWLMRVFQGVM